jgi:hypothetical protein
MADYSLFIDDLRDPANKTDVIARSSSEAIAIVSALGMPDHISFDHDLSGDDTSIIFINWLTNQLIDKKLSFPDDFTFSVHSQNPVGVENIKSKMRSLQKHFK